MARPQIRRRTTRVDSPTTTLRDNKTQLDVNAPLVTREGSDAGQQAQALAEFAGKGVEFMADRRVRLEREGFQKAEQDFARGIFDEEEHQRNMGYMTGRERLRARADAARVVPSVKDRLRQMDTDSMSEDELSSAFNEMVRSEIDIENPSEAEQIYLSEIADFILEAEVDVIGEHKVNSLQASREAEEVDLRDAMGLDYEAGEFNYETLNSEITRMRDGAERNELYWQTLKNMANAANDPTLLENIPSNYANGVPSIKHIPEYEEKIQDETRAIHSRLAAQATAARVEEVRAGTAEADALALRIAHSIVNEGSANPDDMNAYGVHPYAKSATLSALEGTRRGSRDDLEEREANFPYIVGLRSKIHRGESGVDDIMLAYESGLLGSGPAGKREFNALMANLEDAFGRRDRDGNSEANRFSRNLSSRYNPKTQGEFMPQDVTRLNIQIKSEEEYWEKVDGGQNPREAWLEVSAKYDAILDAAPSEFVSNDSLNTSTSSGTLGAASTRAALALQDGNSLRRNKIGAVQLEQMMSDGLLSPEEAEAANQLLQ